MLQWVDESAWIAATLDFPGYNFVTIGMDKVEFKKSVRQGTILKLYADKVKEGKTSIQYEVKVVRDNADPGPAEEIFSTNITFVRIDEQGNKIQLHS